MGLNELHGLKGINQAATGVAVCQRLNQISQIKKPVTPNAVGTARSQKTNTPEVVGRLLRSAEHTSQLHWPARLGSDLGLPTVEPDQASKEARHAQRRRDSREPENEYSRSRRAIA